MATDREHQESMDRHERADQRADRSDSRMDRSDTRADRSDSQAEVEHRSVNDILADINAAMQALERRIKTSAKELEAERKRDQSSLRKIRIIAAVSLFAATLSSVSALAVCEVANENRRTFRATISAAYSPNIQTPAVPVNPDVQARRDSLKRFVFDKTKPLNCINPLAPLIHVYITEEN